MLRGGFAIVDATTLARGATYPGQMIVYGTEGAKEAAGLVPQFTHAAASHPALVGLTDPWAAAGRAVSGRGTAATLGVVYGIDVYEYRWGSKKDVGLNSTEFVSALMVDTTFTLGPPAAGALAGTAIAPGPGTAIGYGAGTFASIWLSVRYRDAAIGWTDAHITTPVAENFGDYWLQYAPYSTAFGGYGYPVWPAYDW